jgi:hypothetical protein
MLKTSEVLFSLLSLGLRVSKYLIHLRDLVNLRKIQQTKILKFDGGGKPEEEGVNESRRPLKLSTRTAGIVNQQSRPDRKMKKSNEGDRIDGVQNHMLQTGDDDDDDDDDEGDNDEDGTETGGRRLSLGCGVHDGKGAWGRFGASKFPPSMGSPLGLSFPMPSHVGHEIAPTDPGHSYQL